MFAFMSSSQPAGRALKRSVRSHDLLRFLLKVTLHTGTLMKDMQTSNFHWIQTLQWSVIFIQTKKVINFIKKIFIHP